MTSATSAPRITTTTLTQPPCVLTIAWSSALPATPTAGLEVLLVERVYAVAGRVCH